MKRLAIAVTLAALLLLLVPAAVSAAGVEVAANEKRGE